MPPSEKKSVWESIREAADRARVLPDWIKAGINLNNQNFETYMPSKEYSQKLDRDLDDDKK